MACRRDAAGRCPSRALRVARRGRCRVRRMTSGVARGLSHWTFWPVYLLAIALLILWRRPWEAWVVPAETAPQEAWIAVRETLPAVDALAVGAVCITRDAGDPGSAWLLCDGRQVARADYPELDNVIGG